MNSEAINAIVALAIIAGVAAIWLIWVRRAVNQKEREAAAWIKCANCSHNKWEHCHISDTIDRCMECGCENFEAKQASDTHS